LSFSRHRPPRPHPPDPDPPHRAHDRGAPHHARRRSRGRHANVGAAQELTGPILTVPVVRRWTDEKQQAREDTTLHRFLPRTLKLRGRVDTEVRRRGIFDVPLYTARVHVEATFALPEAVEIAPQGGEVAWKSAVLTYGISDPKAIRAVS